MEYNAGKIHLVQGILDIGKAMAPPLIREVKKMAREEIVLIDCPPGTSCPMVTAVGGADYVILVTEPTPFGLHDMTLAVETLRKMYGHHQPRQFNRVENTVRMKTLVIIRIKVH